jgi:transcriptional regulator with GAF, ATPase, and Fis domain
MEQAEILWIANASVRALEEAEALGVTVRLERDPEDVCLHVGAPTVVISLPVAGWPGSAVVSHVRRTQPGALIVVQTADAAEKEKLFEFGAAVVCDDSVTWKDLSQQIRNVAELPLQATMEARSRVEPWESALLGQSSRMRQVIDFVRLAGPRRCTVLITGETGTGKEVVARALHLASPRRRRQMVSFCCTAVPEHLLESELFGHVKGAFTGAVGHRIGRFEQAHGSTLFLDEIGDMPLDLQAKLLRVLQEREFQRLGSGETVRVDVRIVAATNADLQRKVAQGAFREDLYYRIAVAGVRLPPLRERLEDVPVLAQHFLQKICRDEALPLKRLSAECVQALQQHSWPGNVRELENAVEAAVALSGDRSTLYGTDFCRAGTLASPTPTHAGEISVPEWGLDFEETVSRIEKSILEQALRQTNGNKKMAASLLGLKRTTLSAKLRTLTAVPATPWRLSAAN